MDRNEAIKTIRKNLTARRNGGTPFTIRGGRGTAWGWIRIMAAPRACPGGWMTDGQCAELATLLGLDRVHPQGVSIMASGDARTEHVQRSAGQEPTVIGVPYWD